MIIFIFLIGAGMAFINNVDGQGNGLYEVSMPDSGVQSNLSMASSTNDALLQTSKTSELNYIEMLSLIGTTIFGGLMAVLTLGSLMESFHVPAPMIVWFISPLGIVLVFWLIEMWLGRPSE